jgi:putative tryptophan/tyrosine transport system substrate-binding protein
MNKLIICFLILIAFIFYLKPSESSYERDVVKVAILTPVVHPSLEQIEQGIVDTLKKDSSFTYDFQIYQAQGNKVLMRSELEDIVQQDHNLLFTIGAQATQMAKEVLSKKQKKTPIIFAAVSNPEGLNLAGGQVTGASEKNDFAQQLAILKKIKPDTQKVLLVFDPTQIGLEQDKNEIQSILKNLNIELASVEIFKNNEIVQKVSPFLSDADVLLTLKDNTVVPGMDALVKLCCHHQILLFATDLDSVDKGAGLGFGVYEYDYGVEAAKKGLSLLKNNLLPQQIPITPVDHYKLKIHSSFLLQQGVDPSALPPLSIPTEVL